MSHTFQYDAPLKGKTIRLLEVLPSDNDSEVKVRLDRHALQNADFDALSYVWGDASNKHKIICNDQELEVTLNLYEALQHRRPRPASVIRHDGTHFQTENLADGAFPLSKRKLWIDAICINNEIEKRKPSKYV